jgi:hypothetical protein
MEKRESTRHSGHLPLYAGQSVLACLQSTSQAVGLDADRAIHAKAIMTQRGYQAGPTGTSCPLPQMAGWNVPSKQELASC